MAEKIELVAQLMGQPDNDEDAELIRIIHKHADRLVFTVDISGEPFYRLNHAMMSAKRSDGIERKIIVWLDPQKLDDNWQPEETEEKGETP
jgi:hypothetical protein